MKGEIEIHQREVDNDTESFLQENIETFQNDAVFLHSLMLRGERLTAKTVVQKYGKEPRRLRDIFHSGKCERKWVLNEKGKRLFVEYFVTLPSLPTKTELIQKADRVIEQMKNIPNGTVQNLFQ